MRFFLGTLTIIAAIFYSFMAAAKDCAPPITNLHSIVPQSWIVPGSYKVWNTNCVNYVFNYIDNPADASWFSPETGNFSNFGFATNTTTELEEDHNNGTVAAQINAWSFVKSGTHRLFGAAVQAVDTVEGDALTTIVALESQVNSRNSENSAPKVGVDTVLFTAHGSEADEVGSNFYNLNSWAHFISASPSRNGEHAGWERGIHVSRYGLGTSVNRNFKTMVDLEEVPGSVCLVTFTRKNGKIGCLRYNIEEDQMEMVGDIHANSDVRVFQSFSVN